MSTATETIEGFVKQEYKYGFFTDVETDSAPPGLNEDIVRLISTKKRSRNSCSNGGSKPFAIG